MLDCVQRGEFKLIKGMCIAVINITFVTIGAFIIIISKVTNRCIALDIFTKTFCLLRS